MQCNERIVKSSENETTCGHKTVAIKSSAVVLRADLYRCYIGESANANLRASILIGVVAAAASKARSRATIISSPPDLRAATFIVRQVYLYRRRAYWRR